MDSRNSIKNLIRNFLDNELALGSLILIIFSGLANILSYLFQMIMARPIPWGLGVEDYGSLAVITNIAGIFGMFTLAIQTLVSKKTTELAVKKDYSGISSLAKSLIKKLFNISLILFILFSIASIFLSKELKIEYWALFIVGFFIFGSFLYPIMAGITQGLKKFSLLGFSIIFSCFIKLGVAIILVFAGFKIYGASLGIVLGLFGAFLLLLPLIKNKSNSPTRITSVKLLTRENIYTFYAMFIFVLIYSIDIIFAKIFFSPEIAGRYAVISMIGKIILFTTLPIGTAMFPINSERFLGGNTSKSVLYKSLLLNSGVCIILLLFFALFPEFTINILFGSQYIGYAPILVSVAGSFALISFLNIFLLNSIARNEFNKRKAGLLLLLFIVQIILLSLFHSTIQEFSIAFLSSSIINFFGGLFFLKKNE